jgi:2-polyprenyl-3-methyl-5-hydroxy-6-metoxy-1,4-benzoquinol methylase
MGDHTQDIARYFDRAACCSAGDSGGLGHVSRALLRLFDDVDLTGRSVLDVGCGPGALALALHRRGAGLVTGIDLSPASLDRARGAAAAAGLSLRVVLGDAATTPLDAHDVVVLDKVVCCYGDHQALLANALPAVRDLCAIALPHSHGLRGQAARLGLGAENTWRRLRADPFRAYVHDTATIARMLRSHGFGRIAARDLSIWHVALYKRR